MSITTRLRNLLPRRPGTRPVPTVHPAAEPLFDAIRVLKTYQPTTPGDAAHLARCLAGDWDHGTWSVVAEVLEAVHQITSRPHIADQVGPTAARYIDAATSDALDTYLNGPDGDPIVLACQALENPSSIRPADINHFTDA